MNLQTLAPPFNHENAVEKGRLGGIQSGIAKRAKKQKMLSVCDTDKAQTRAKLQVDKVLTWMENCKDKDTYGNLVAMLDRLWNKAFPTQAAVRSKPGRQSAPAEIREVTPQPAVSPAANPTPQAPT